MNWIFSFQNTQLQSGFGHAWDPACHLQCVRCLEWRPHIWCSVRSCWDTPTSWSSLLRGITRMDIHLMGQVSSLNLVGLHLKLVWNSPKTSSGESGVQKITMEVHQFNEIAVLDLRKGTAFWNISTWIPCCFSCNISRYKPIAVYVTETNYYHHKSLGLSRPVYF